MKLLVFGINVSYTGFSVPKTLLAESAFMGMENRID